MWWGRCDRCVVGHGVVGHGVVGNASPGLLSGTVFSVVLIGTGCSSRCAGTRWNRRRGPVDGAETVTSQALGSAVCSASSQLPGPRGVRCVGRRARATAARREPPGRSQHAGDDQDQVLSLLHGGSPRGEVPISTGSSAGWSGPRYYDSRPGRGSAGPRSAGGRCGRSASHGSTAESAVGDGPGGASPETLEAAPTSPFGELGCVVLGRGGRGASYMCVIRVLSSEWASTGRCTKRAS